jgi:hypothetical protein
MLVVARASALQNRSACSWPCGNYLSQVHILKKFDSIVILYSKCSRILTFEKKIGNFLSQRTSPYTLRRRVVPGRARPAVRRLRALPPPAPALPDAGNVNLFTDSHVYAYMSTYTHTAGRCPSLSLTHAHRENEITTEHVYIHICTFTTCTRTNTNTHSLTHAHTHTHVHNMYTCTRTGSIGRYQPRLVNIYTLCVCVCVCVGTQGRYRPCLGRYRSHQLCLHL